MQSSGKSSVNLLATSFFFFFILYKTIYNLIDVSCEFGMKSFVIPNKQVPLLIYFIAAIKRGGFGCVGGRIWNDVCVRRGVVGKGRGWEGAWSNMSHYLCSPPLS